MISALAGSAAHDPLAVRLSQADNRVLTLTAPAGYDKHAFVRAYGAHVGTVIEADLDPRRDRDPARAILAAIVSRDGSRATRSAADRLAQRRGIRVSSAREALRREWSHTSGRELLLVRDAAGTLGSAEGADLLAELVATLPPERTIALSTRTTLPPALADIVERQRHATVTATDLALSRDVTRELGEAIAVPARLSDAVYELTAGWPLVTRLLLMVAAHERSEFLSALAAVPRESRLAFAAHRVIATLDEPVLDALVASALARGAGAGDVMRVLGAACDDAVLYRAWSLLVRFTFSRTGRSCTRRRSAPVVAVRSCGCARVRADDRRARRRPRLRGGRAHRARAPRRGARRASCSTVRSRTVHPLRRFRTTNASSSGSIRISSSSTPTSGWRRSRFGGSPSSGTRTSRKRRRCTTVCRTRRRCTNACSR